jgi:hypothetical protein
MKTPQGSAPGFRPGRHLEIFDGAVIDPYQQRGKYAEPTVCSDCGAVYLCHHKRSHIKKDVLPVPVYGKTCLRAI